jgi:integrase/recombinase XerD
MTIMTEAQTYFPSQESAHAARNQIIWDRMEALTVGQIISEWLEGLSLRTMTNYSSGVRVLESFGLLNLNTSLQAFSLVNHDAMIDRVKQLPMKETTRQARAALYISFTRYLSRRFPAVFKKVMPSREGTEKTFFRVHDKCTTEAMNAQQWTSFISALHQINHRDCLFAKVTLQGGKRFNEVASLQVNQIDWEKKEIAFSQSKTKGGIKETVITYPDKIMNELRDYIGERTGLVFVSKSGNGLAITQLARNFAKAGKMAGIAFKVTPHVLRSSCITFLKQQGFNDSDIMKVTGHASAEMVNAYDKTDRADNPTKRVSLVG